MLWSRSKVRRRVAIARPLVVVFKREGKEGMGFGHPAHIRERGEILGHGCLLFSEAGARIFMFGLT